MSFRNPLYEALQQKILVIDGAMGTMIQTYRLQEEDYRGIRFKDHPCLLKGNNDLLSITQPQIIKEIHTAYLQAGADLIETNTFNANRISMADYQMQDIAYEISLAGAKVARESVDAFIAKQKAQMPGESIPPKFVVGILGPTNRTASLSPDVNRPAYRNVSFDELVFAYAESVKGLMDGRVDTIMVETIFDTLNAKAALFAIEQVFTERNQRLPIMISVTITDASGRTLSGQTTEAFWHSVRHSRPLSVGLNCALGASQMRPFLQILSDQADCFVTVHPNAGLPNAFGGYDETADQMAEIIKEYALLGFVNVVGGCCGTNPAHISAIAQSVKNIKPRQPTPQNGLTKLSGLEPLILDASRLFINIGERTNVTGSAVFRKLIQNQDYEKALEVAKQQVDAGAQIIDINMDEGMLDSEGAMIHFLNMIAGEPDISKIPLMLDSSKWQVLEEGLKRIQGKGIVNSISLKEGQDLFLEQARLIQKYGAATVIMAFDEKGQADTLERKVEIAKRAYHLLRTELDFPPEDMIFDLNVFAIGTGIDEHRRYAIDFLEAIRILKQSLGSVHFSGGISNLSFSFRGNDKIREAMHSIFLYHAIQVGLDMGIVNAGQLEIYENIDPTLRNAIEDLIFDRREDATEQLLSLAEQYKGAKKNQQDDLAWRNQDFHEKIRYAIIKGDGKFIEEDSQEAYDALGSALHVIEGPLMKAMGEVGDLFGAGKMFLPQVVKSARVMKKAVAYLEPMMHANDAEIQKAGKILMATVKGDVHDIGKNIVGIVLQCNHYEVIDIGVMQACQDILKAAQEHQVDIIGLSGLITPSLDEMVFVAKEMNRLKMQIPLLIGGATTSKRHTAIKIAPQYDGPVIHVNDASRAVGVASQLLGQNKDQYVAQIEAEYQVLREQHQQSQGGLKVTIDQARANRHVLDWQKWQVKPNLIGQKLIESYDLNRLAQRVDWTPFFQTWGLAGRYPEILKDEVVGVEANKLLDDALQLMSTVISKQAFSAKAVFGIWPAEQQGDDILLYTDEQKNQVLTKVHTLRQQMKKGNQQSNYALADFVAPKGIDSYMGMFVVTIHIDADFENQLKADDYQSILLKALADRFAESFAESLHEDVRKVEWAYAQHENLDHEDLIQEKYIGIRPAPGYPACPDHTEKEAIFDVLGAREKIGAQLTESFAMLPNSAVCGYYFAHPDLRYFGVGKIEMDQLRDYAGRKGWSEGYAQRWLAHCLND
jgi:5-methyltetrahydrofolate--homocysteine methyltransferase